MAQDIGNFNSHAHVERDGIIVHYRKSVCHFNSHAHVERDRWHILSPVLQDISTHTLTWSVTPAKVFNAVLSGISTHTLTWSVTAAPSAPPSITAPISTHTLTWSVTDKKGINERSKDHFNSHAHVERDE